MYNTSHSLMLIGVMTLFTVLLRFLPFWLFSQKTPKAILYLGDVLPYANMAMLVVFCLKGTDLLSGSHGIPEAIAVVLVVLLHKWKHSILLSILGGTIVYMVLVQLVFV